MIEELYVMSLILLENNPRRISRHQMDKLKKSLLVDPDFLKHRPCLVNLKDGKYHVYAGNQRVRAAQELGWKKIPCVVDKNLPEDVMKARIIKDNKTYGEFDFDILANEWEAEDLLDFGFTEDDLVPFSKIDEEDDTKEEAQNDEKEPNLCDKCKKEINER